MSFYKKTIPNVKYIKYCKQTGVLHRFHLQRKCWVKVARTPTKRGYYRMRVGDSHYMQHVVAFVIVKNRMPVSEIDHKNGNGLDNRWCNLRETDRRGNCGNKLMHRKGKIPGVTYRPNRKRWVVNTTINKQLFTLGSWKTESKATMIYKKALTLINSRDMVGLRLFEKEIKSNALIGRPKSNV